MAEQPTALNDVLNDDAPEPSVPETGETPATEEHRSLPGEKRGTRSTHRMKELDERAEGAGMRRDPETGQFIPKEPAAPAAAAAENPPETTTETPAAQSTPEPAKTEAEQMSEKERGLLTAAQEERRKRQELERRLAEIEARRNEKPEEPVDFWQDPEGRIAKIEQNMQRALTKQKMDLTETYARNRYPDFQEKADVFRDMLQQTPGLVQQWVASSDPAEFAYQHASMHMAVREAGGLQNLRGKMEADIRAKVEKEVRDRIAKEAADREAAAEAKAGAIPKPLSEQRGSAAPTRETYTGPTPLSNILGEED